MNISCEAVCYLCNSHGPEELKCNCVCVGKCDGAVHYLCHVQHVRVIRDAWEGTDYSQYITPWKVCGKCNCEYRRKFLVTMVVHCCQFIHVKYWVGLNWLQIESKYHLISVQLALGRDMNASQRYEVGVTAKLI